MRSWKAILSKTAIFALLMVPFFSWGKEHSIPDYFPLKVGYWWKYRIMYGDKSNDITMKITKTERAKDGTLLYLLETTGADQVSQEWYSKMDGWVLAHKTAYPNNHLSSEYSPIKTYLMNPLVPNGTWEWKGTGLMGISIEEKSKVVGDEVVSVPAGKFTAMRVDADLTQGGTNIKKSIWYLNRVGVVKSKVETSGIVSSAELLEYSLK